MHRHTWIIDKREEQPSPAEVSQSLGRLPTKVWGETAHTFFTRPIIVEKRCTSCGTQKVERI